MSAFPSHFYLFLSFHLLLQYEISFVLFCVCVYWDEQPHGQTDMTREKPFLQWKMDDELLEKNSTH